MSRKSLIIGSILICVFLALQATAQQPNDKQTWDNLLPLIEEPVNCELALRYIDDAINRSVKQTDSVFIIIIKAGQGESNRVSKTRARDIARYLRYRGLSKFEIAVSESVNKNGSFDLFIVGKLLYTIPLELRKTPEFIRCGAF